MQPGTRYRQQREQHTQHAEEIVEAEREFAADAWILSPRQSADLHPVRPDIPPATTAKVFSRWRRGLQSWFTRRDPDQGTSIAAPVKWPPRRSVRALFASARG